MDGWKPIDRAREYGNKTDFVEKSEFSDDPIKYFVDDGNECEEVSRKVLCEKCQEQTGN